MSDDMKKRVARVALDGAVDGIVEEFAVSGHRVQKVNIENLSVMVRISHPQEGPRYFTIKISEPQ